MKKYIIYSLLLILLSSSIQAMEERTKAYEHLSESWSAGRETTNTQHLYNFVPLLDIHPVFRHPPLSAENHRNLAIADSRRKINELLLKSKTDLNDKDWFNLNWALKYDECADLIEIMLQKGVRPKASSCFGDTLLHRACWGGSLKNVTLLLKYNVNQNITDTTGQTPLMIAVTMGHLAILELLLQYQADSNVQDRPAGKTALMVAAHRNSSWALHTKDKSLRKNIVVALLKSGANPLIKNNKGKTAIDIARQKGFDDIAKLMETFTISSKENNTMDAEIEAECSICFEHLGHPDNVFTTSCNHTFHAECLKKWQGTCPLCRNNYKEKQL